MARTFEKYLVSIMVFLICFVISVLNSEFTAIIYPAKAQTTDTQNMTAPMMESARFHLKAADGLLMKGDTNAALDQINLAEIQLSLLNMGFQETSMNQTQAMEFIIGGSLSSMRMAANCIIDSQAMVRCMQ
jgi:phosphoglycerol transferase MdoB-like AlkP superfamily enzyme